MILECSAEPSVLAGVGGSPEYVINTNLMGTINCLEVARQQNADLLLSIHANSLIKDKKVRLAVIRKSHLLFFHFYFAEYVKHETAPFQKEMYALTEDENVKKPCSGLSIVEEKHAVMVEELKDLLIS